VESILIIEDDALLRKMYWRFLESAGYEVVEASDGHEGVKIYQENPADLVITDLIMPKKEGIEVILALKRDHPDVKIIAISGGGKNNPESYLYMAKKLGAMQTISKPIDRKLLLKVVSECLST
jgi:DNA-binding NtrC family response regulator